MRFLLRIVLAMMLTVVGSNIVGSPVYAAGESAKNSPEFNLAVLNAGRWVKEDDVTIIRFRYLLNSISAKSGDSPTRISDMVAKARDMIRSEYGKEVNLLAFTEEVNRVVLAAPKGTKLDELIVLLLISIGRS